MSKYKIALKKVDGTMVVPDVIAKYDGAGNEITAHYMDKMTCEEKFSELSNYATANDIENIFATVEQVSP